MPHDPADTPDDITALRRQEIHGAAGGWYDDLAQSAFITAAI